MDIKDINTNNFKLFQLPLPKTLTTINTSKSVYIGDSIKITTNTLKSPTILFANLFTNNNPVIEWQTLAEKIIKNKENGKELYNQIEIYPNILNKTIYNTQPISIEQDVIKNRVYSMRPRIGNSYFINNGKIYNKLDNKLAEPAAVIFDRTHNLITVLDKEQRPILALEARNNTVKHFEDKPPSWYMNNSIVKGSNAPAPNGIYAIKDILEEDSQSGKTFGSYKISFAGGIIADRAILIHSRDKASNSEIPWHRYATGLQNKTHGCILMQDPDLIMLAKLLKQRTKPVAIVVQGDYKANFNSPIQLINKNY